MTYFETSFRNQKFSSETSRAISDNSYSLRKMLLRGAEEANYRHLLFEGHRALEFKRMLYQFQDIIDDLDGTLDDEGRVSVEHRITMIKSIQDCQYLFALDYADTIADYRNLMAYLTRDVCPECQGAVVGA